MEPNELIAVRKSESVAALAGALAKAQGAMEAASKDRKNPHFGQKYATLASIWDACRAPLAANGLAVVQLPSMSESQLTVETHLLHESGEYIVSTLTMPVDKLTAQGVGTAITYGRRYALAAMVGVAPDDDDDGNAASGRDDTRTPAEKQPAKTNGKKQAEESKSDTRTPAEILTALREKLPAIKTAAEILKARAYIKDRLQGADQAEGFQELEWKAIEIADNPFQAAASRVAMTFNKGGVLGLVELRRRIGRSELFSADAKQDLDEAIRKQEGKADEAERQAHSNTAA